MQDHKNTELYFRIKLKKTSAESFKLSTRDEVNLNDQQNPMEEELRLQEH